MVTLNCLVRVQVNWGEKKNNVLLKGLRTWLISYRFHKLCCIKCLSEETAGKEQCFYLTLTLILPRRDFLFSSLGSEQVSSGWVTSNLWLTDTRPSQSIPPSAPCCFCSAHNATSCSRSRLMRKIRISPWLTTVRAPHCDVAGSNEIITPIVERQLTQFCATNTQNVHDDIRRISVTFIFEWIWLRHYTQYKTSFRKLCNLITGNRRHRICQRLNWPCATVCQGFFFSTFWSFLLSWQWVFHLISESYVFCPFVSWGVA